jgi:TctA family transporter
MLTAGFVRWYRVSLRKESGPAGMDGRAAAGIRLAPLSSEVAMLWTLIVLVLLFWVVGFLFDIAGGFIHLLLLVALAIFLVNVLSGRRRAV